MSLFSSYFFVKFVFNDCCAEFLVTYSFLATFDVPMAYLSYFSRALSPFIRSVYFFQSIVFAQSEELVETRTNGSGTKHGYEIRSEEGQGRRECK